MSKTIYELVNANEIAGYYNAKQTDVVPALGTVLFPRKKQLGLNLSWIKGAKGVPVVLKPSALDVKASIRDRVGLEKIDTDMPFFKESMLVNEKDRQELNKLLNTGSQIYLDIVLSKIFDDTLTLVDGALAQEERLRMQLLSSGEIQVAAEGVDYFYNYDMPQSHKAKAATPWAAEDANPLEDILKAQEIINCDTGADAVRAICARKVWNELKASKQIKMDIDRIHGSSMLLTDSLLNQYLASVFGLKVEVYNKKFTDETGATKGFFPDDVFTLIPEGALGNTYFGTTPEESDLLSGATGAQVAIVNTGMAVTTIKETDPVNVTTKVSMITLPSFERIDEMFILNTKA